MRTVPRPKTNTLQVSVHVPEAWESDIEGVAEAMSQPGITVTKADVMRAALRLGLDVLAAKHGKARGKR